MIGPTWLADTLAAVLLVVAVYDLGRLAVVAAGSSRRTERDVDAYHVAMGISMAGMLTGSLTDFERQAWAVVFAFTTVWFVLRLPWNDALRAVEQPVGHRTLHVLSSGAMVYMMLAVPGGSMAVMSAGTGTGTRLPGLAALLAVVLLVATAVDADRLLLRPRRRGTPGMLPAPAAAVVAPVGPSTGPAVSGRTEGSPAGLSMGTVTEPSTAPAVRPTPTTVSPSDRFLAPRLAAATEVVMGLAMVAMLVAMAR